MTHPAGPSTKALRAASATGTPPPRAARRGRSSDRQAAEQIREYLRERLAQSAALLGEAEAAPRKTVHSFRKLLKRVRATLRLLSDAEAAHLMDDPSIGAYTDTQTELLRMSRWP